ncbi:MAG: phage holin family protein [Clostridia bacterium]|nr:phage holin family protein [Clostridia bacterium]
MRDFFLHTYDLLLRGGAAVLGFLQGITRSECRGAVFLVLLMAGDYLTGVLAAARGKSRHTENGRLSSAAGYKGLLHKAAMLAVLLIAYGLDRLLHEGNTMFFTAVLWMYISNECLSLLENLALCGVPVPPRLRSMLEALSAGKKITPAK